MAGWREGARRRRSGPATMGRRPDQSERAVDPSVASASARRTVGARALPVSPRANGAAPRGEQADRHRMEIATPGLASAPARILRTVEPPARRGGAPNSADRLFSDRLDGAITRNPYGFRNCRTGGMAAWNNAMSGARDRMTSDRSALCCLSALLLAGCDARSSSEFGYKYFGDSTARYYVGRSPEVLEKDHGMPIRIVYLSSDWRLYQYRCDPATGFIPTNTVDLYTYPGGRACQVDFHATKHDGSWVISNVRPAEPVNCLGAGYVSRCVSGLGHIEDEVETPSGRKVLRVISRDWSDPAASVYLRPQP